MTTTNSGDAATSKNKLPVEQRIAPTILAAKRLIDGRGWVRDVFCTDKGYCIVGAILAVQQDIAVQELSFSIIRAQCGLYVSQWNDTVAKNKRQVIEMLGYAAARAKVFANSPRPSRKAGIRAFL